MSVEIKEIKISAAIETEFFRIFINRASEKAGENDGHEKCVKARNRRRRNISHSRQIKRQ